MEKRIVIRYIRDEKKAPYGVVVGMPDGNLGCSLCNKGDKWNKDYGKELAIGRAVLNKRAVVASHRKDLSVLAEAIHKVNVALCKPFSDITDVIEITPKQCKRVRA